MARGSILRGSRIGIILGGTALFFIAVLWYLQLRGTHRKDFPFLWGSLFLNGILLIVAGAALLIVVATVARATARLQLITAVLIGLPSLGLALADYGLSELELDIIPGRFVQDSGHQIGMLGFGLALGLGAYALTRDRLMGGLDTVKTDPETQNVNVD